MDNKLTQYIIKHSKKRDKELKYDFMPSLLEIIERPTHKAGTLIIWGTFTLLIAIVIWSCMSEIDIVITSSGTIQPIGSLNIVQAYSNGSIKSIDVSEGQHVEKGDILIKLDTQSIDIDENQLKSQLKILEIQQRLYEKIQKGESLSIFRIDEYDEEFRPYVQAIIDTNISYNNTISNLEKERINTDLNCQIAQIQLDEYNLNGTENQVKSQELVIQQYQLVNEQIKLQIDDTKIQYNAQINSKLSEINQNIDEIQINLEKYEIAKENQNISAPVSGYVNNLSVNTIGEIVTSSQEIITIVPDNTPVEMVCYIKNMDIADINVGMETYIKLEAYPYNKYGTVNGIVKYISPSSFASEQFGNVYLVKIEINNTNENIDIISGLSGIVEIKIGKRTVMDYFLEPIIKGFDESLKEK